MPAWSENADTVIVEYSPVSTPVPVKTPLIPNGVVELFVIDTVFSSVGMNVIFLPYIPAAGLTNKH